MNKASLALQFYAIEFYPKVYFAEQSKWGFPELHVLFSVEIAFKKP